jgi:hypothetical protein
MSGAELHDRPMRTPAAPPESPYAALAEQIYRQRVLRARHQPPESKALAGQRLFESACKVTLAGIRNQNPGLGEAECRQILRQRLAWRRRLLTSE